MSFFTTEDGIRLHYRIEGPADAPVLILSNSLGADMEMWRPQMDAFLSRFRVLRYDTCGHGASDVRATGFAIDRLGQDVLDLANHLQIDSFSFCGLSLGGMTGMWVASKEPGRVERLILCNTAAWMSQPEMWRERIELVRDKGMDGILDVALKRFFTDNFLASEDPMMHVMTASVKAASPDGYAACCAAIRDMDLRDALSAIKAPTLIIAGQHDASTPTDPHATDIRAAIDGARLVELSAAHISNIECARAFTREAMGFLVADGWPWDRPFRNGMALRRATLGAAHVDRSMNETSPFMRDYQEMVTRHAWGAIWSRPGLERSVRRILVLVITASLSRWEEYDLHLRAALADGLEPDLLKEVLLHLSVYAGVPAANTAFKRADKLLEEAGLQRPSG